MIDPFFELIESLYFSPGRRYVAQLTFKFDESANPRTFVVGGMLTDIEGWRNVHVAIRDSLAFENAKLPPEMRVCRYHASPMNCRDNEYALWDTAEGRIRIKRMTKKMIETISANLLLGFSVGLDLQAHKELFPEKPRSHPYTLCMQLIMDGLGRHFVANGVSQKIAMVHDRSDYDMEALSAFNELVQDSKWEYQNLFLTIIPLSWRDDTGLQAADAIAYETFKELDRQLFDLSRKKSRVPLRILLEKLPNISAAHLDRAVLEYLKEIEEENGK